MRELFKHVDETGILSSYWKRIDRENKLAKRGLLEAERKRRKMQDGSAYDERQDTPLADIVSEQLSDWSNENDE